MTTPARRRYVEIDALKGFAIFLVVLGHSVIIGPINLHANVYCKALVDFVTSVHVPLFFIVSGFCFSYKGDYKSFLSKKISRILIPYVVFNLLSIIPKQLFPQLINGNEGLLDSVVGVFLYGNQVAWFLYTLFFLFLLYPLIYRFLLKTRVSTAITTAAIASLAVVRPPIQLFSIDNVTYYLLFFHLGVLLKMSRVNVFDIQMTKKHVALFIAALVLWVGLVFSPFSSHVLMLSALVGSVACFYFTRLRVFNNLFARFGEYSMQLYLLNGYTLVVSRTIICRLTSMPVIIILFNLLIDFFVSYFIIKYVCRRIPVVNRVMGMV